MASSQSRIEANRENALYSTGPKTDEGKKRSCLNALRNGFNSPSTFSLTKTRLRA